MSQSPYSRVLWLKKLEPLESGLGTPMETQTKAILPLPISVLSRVRSHSQVSCLSQALEEVVNNSLDAQSSKISIQFGLGRSFTVEDNGCGIPPAHVHLLCKRYCSSKWQGSNSCMDAPKWIGHRGEALASIAQVAHVQITTRAKNTFETTAKVVKGGKVVHCGVSAKPRMHSGTTVIVEEFMHNRPVRLRQFERWARTIC